MCVLWLTHVCAMSHSCVCHDSFIWVPWLVHVCAMTHWYVLRCLYMCVMTHSCVCAMIHIWGSSLSCVWWCWGGLSIRVPCLPYVCAMTHSYVCHDSLIGAEEFLYLCHVSLVCVPWLIHARAMTHSDVRHGVFLRNTRRSRWCRVVSGPWRIHLCVPWPIHVCAMTPSYVCHDSFISVPCPNSLDHA